MEHTFKKLDTVTITRTGQQGLVVGTYMHNLRLKIQVRTYRNGPALSYEAHQLEPYTVQSPDTIFYMDDLGVLWPYEVLDVSADGKSVYVKNEKGEYEYLLISTASLIVPASMAMISRAMGGQ